MIDESFVEMVLAECDQMPLDAVWLTTEKEARDFDGKCAVFYWVLEKMLNSGRFRLQKNGQCLLGTPRDQVESFRSVFPKSERPNPNYPEIRVYHWFFEPDCPGEAFWRVDHPDGTVEWVQGT